MRYPEPEPEYRHFEPPHHHQEYQHFPFPKYNEPYGFKREPDAPYDMSQMHAHSGHAHAHGHAPLAHSGPPAAYKRDEDAYNGIKRECEDPYSFVEEDPMCGLMAPPHHPHAPHHPHMLPHQHPHMMHQQMCLQQPKKRGRKKKIKDENG